jgi:hypothetical protein
MGKTSGSSNLSGSDFFFPIPVFVMSTKCHMYTRDNVPHAYNPHVRFHFPYDYTPGAVDHDYMFFVSTSRASTTVRSGMLSIAPFLSTHIPAA